LNVHLSKFTAMEKVSNALISVWFYIAAIH
jgi:hypothetical protein